MSFDIATIILRTVSACAASPYFDLVELGDAVDEHRDLVAEVGAELVERVVGVLDRVVQQRGGHRRRADAEVGEDLRDRERVRDVRLAALALLALVGALGDRVRALDEARSALGCVARTVRSSGSSTGLTVGARTAEAGQPRPHPALTPAIEPLSAVGSSGGAAPAGPW